MPARTALGPAVRVTVMVTVPPDATVTGKLVHAPWLKSVVMLTVWGPDPSFTVIDSRRATLSQSTA